MYRKGIFVCVAKMSDIFLGMADIPDNFVLVNSRCWVQNSK